MKVYYSSMECLSSLLVSKEKRIPYRTIINLFMFAGLFVKKAISHEVSCRILKHLSVNQNVIQFNNYFFLYFLVPRLQSNLLSVVTYWSVHSSPFLNKSNDLFQGCQTNMCIQTANSRFLVLKDTERSWWFQLKEEEDWNWSIIANSF